jgi:CHAT domain-containing protein/Tfp pilus assembly protein PilF
MKARLKVLIGLFTLLGLTGDFVGFFAIEPVQRLDQGTGRAERLVAEADQLALQYRSESSHAALDKYQNALRVWDANDDRVNAVRTMIRIADVYSQLGNSKQWVKYSEMAAIKAKSIQDELLQIEALVALGTAQLRQGDILKAKETLSRVLEIRSVPDGQEEAYGLYLSGAIRYRSGEADKAAQAFERAAAIWNRLHNTTRLGDVTWYLAGIDVLMSRYDMAQTRGRDALALFETINDKGRQAKALITLGNFETRLGRKQEALNFYERARPLVNGSGDLINEQALLSGMARTYFDLGDSDAALRFFNFALENSRTLGDTYGIAVAERGIGQSDFARGDTQKALVHLTNALKGFREVFNTRFEALALRDIAFVYEASGDRAKALEYLNQTIDRSRSLSDWRIEASGLIGVGHLYETGGELDRALGYHEQALKLSEAAEDTFGRLSAFYRIAECLRQMGKFDEALGRTSSALEAIESMRSSVANSGLRASYFASVREQYELFIDLLMRPERQNGSLSDAVRALEASERSRARTLIDNISETRVSIKEGVDPKQLEREASLRALLDAAVERYTQLRTTNPKAPTLQQLSDDVQRLTSEYEELQGQIRVRSPRYAALVQPEPLKLREIQNEVLDGNSLLLEYSVGEENTYLWAVTREEFSSYVLPGRLEIDKKVRRLRELIAARVTLPNEKPADFQARVKAAEEQYPQVAAELSQMLLGPVAGKLGTNRLVVVGEGVLQYLPFGALPTPQSALTSSPVPLVVEHEIVNLPSASTLAVIRREAPMRGMPDRTLAVFADPVFEAQDSRVQRPVRITSSRAAPVATIAQALRGSDALGPRIDFPRLPSTRQEAEAILAMVPEDRRLAALSFNATRAAAMNPDLKRYRIVHFATHTVLDDDHPDLSSLVLSLVDERGNPQSGFLRLRDMYNLSLSAELVVLSACETALGKEVKGEGLMSMVRGFMYSGTPRVLASLWKVDDEATADLMKEFYKQLLEAKLTPAAALRKAQITQMQKKSRQSPYYWAGFQLQGEWR